MKFKKTFLLNWYFNISISIKLLHLFEQTLSSGTHSQGCCGISPSESLIQWYSMHRAHFIAVVYSRLALKQSGANSQAPFRLNSSVKNSWQYLNTHIKWFYIMKLFRGMKKCTAFNIPAAHSFSVHQFFVWLCNSIGFFKTSTWFTFCISTH